MARSDFTVRNDINDHMEARDGLNHVVAMVDFLQSALTLQNAGEIQAMSTTGLYYIFEDMKGRIRSSELILAKAENKNKVVDINELSTNDDTKALKLEFINLIDEKFSILLYALAGLREESKATEITSNDILKFETLVSNSRFEIEEMINH